MHHRRLQLTHIVHQHIKVCRSLHTTALLCHADSATLFSARRHFSVPCAVVVSWKFPSTDFCSTSLSRSRTLIRWYLIGVLVPSHMYKAWDSPVHLTNLWRSPTAQSSLIHPASCITATSVSDMAARPVHGSQVEPDRRMQTCPASTISQPFSTRPASSRSSTTAHTALVPTNMPEPTLGCQIAPHYDREQWPYNSESDTTDTESEAESTAQEHAVNDELAIEKAETQHSRGITPALSKINTQRSRRRSNAAPQPPVGFWHWQMVRFVQH